MKKNMLFLLAIFSLLLTNNTFSMIAPGSLIEEHLSPIQTINKNTEIGDLDFNDMMFDEEYQLTPFIDSDSADETSSESYTPESPASLPIAIPGSKHKFLLKAETASLSIDSNESYNSLKGEAAFLQKISTARRKRATETRQVRRELFAFLHPKSQSPKSSTARKNKLTKTVSNKPQKRVVSPELRKIVEQQNTYRLVKTGHLIDKDVQRRVTKGIKRMKLRQKALRGTKKYKKEPRKVRVGVFEMELEDITGEEAFRQKIEAHRKARTKARMDAIKKKKKNRLMEKTAILTQATQFMQQKKNTQGKSSRNVVDFDRSQ